MLKKLPVLGSVVFALVLTACASMGTDVPRVPENELVLGSTTKQEIVGRLGQPRRESTEVKNDKEVLSLFYTHATAYTNDAQISGVAAARSQVFSFYEDKLVGHQFTSNFKSESTNFDDSVVASFKEGETTRSDVVAKLGPPTGHWIYPLVERPEDKAIRYGYGFVDTRKAGLPRTIKRLTVVLRPDDVVREIELDIVEPN